MFFKRKLSKNKGFPFANILFPYDAENQHVLTVGAARSGKNGPLLEYISEIRSRGNKFICHDRKGELASIFYRPGIDHIINLYDQRFLLTGWNLMQEVETPQIDIPLIARALIPNSNDVFWSNAARIVLEALLNSAYEAGDLTNMGLWNRLSCNLVDMIKHLNKSNVFASTAAIDLLANGDRSSKTAQSILSILRTYSGIFEPLKDVTGNFSTKQWLKDKEGDIFLTNYAKTETVNSPLLTLFIDLTISEILTRENTYDCKDYIYLFLSEFNALQRMDALNSALTEGSAKGLCLYTEIQDFGKTAQIYGRELTQTIQANHGTIIIFRSRGKNADECSQFFSKVRVQEVSKSKSKGGSGQSKSRTVNVREKTLILPNQISSLPSHHAFIWYPGRKPVKVEWHPDNWKRYQVKNKHFEMRNLQTTYQDKPVESIEADEPDETREEDIEALLKAVEGSDFDGFEDF